jgi:uncharacterized membrane protein YuzA (DUF378 family)
MDSTHRGLHAIDWIAMILMIVGGLNWALVGLADTDVVASLFGEGSAFTRLIYILVGLAALYGIYMCIRWQSRANRA